MEQTKTLNCRDDVVLTRSITSHTYYTHFHLIKKERLSICRTYGYSTSIKHIFTECRDTREVWQRYMAYIGSHILEENHNSLGTDEDTKRSDVIYEKYYSIH